MKALAALAARRGLEPHQLAKLADREPESLMRSFYAGSPRLETVGIICDALRLGRLVARALLSKLDARDATELRDRIVRAIETHGQEALGAYAWTTAQETRSLLERQPVKVTLDVGQRTLLALYRLRPPPAESDLADLGPIVGAIAAAFRANGHVFALPNRRLSDNAKMRRSLEAQAWTHLLCESIGLEPELYFGRRRERRQPKKRAERLYAIVGPYLVPGGALLTSQGKRYNRLDVQALQRFNEGIRAARRAFRETFYLSENEEQS